MSERNVVQKKSERILEEEEEKTTQEVKVKEKQPQSPPDPHQEVKVNKVIPVEVTSVLLVPCTSQSELAKMLRKDEKAILKQSGYQNSTEKWNLAWLPP